VPLFFVKIVKTFFEKLLMFLEKDEELFKNALSSFSVILF